MLKTIAVISLLCYPIHGATLRTSTKAIDLIKKYEGCVLKVYKDSAGFMTVGYGHKVLSQDRLKPTSQITQAQADDFLLKDLARTEVGVDRLLHVDVNDNQFDALVSLAFNIGIGAFERSSMLEALNTRRFVTASEQFLLWDRASGIVIPGLLARRQEEQSLFKDPA